MAIKKISNRLLSVLLGLIMLLCLLPAANAGGTVSSAAPVILRQPVNAITSRTDRTWLEFTLLAEGQGLTYQWQIDPDDDGRWENCKTDADWCSGADTDCFRVSTILALEQMTRYRCIVMDKNYNQTISNAVRIQYTPDLVISEQPTDAPAGAAGSWALFSLTAEGQAELTYQWQWEYNGSGNWFYTVGSGSLFSGTDTDSFKVQIQEDTALYRFRCLVKDADGNQVYSNPVRVKPDAASSAELTVTKHPVNIVTDSTDKRWIEYSLTAEGSGTLHYQWQRDDDGNGNWKNCENNASCSGADTNRIRVLVLPVLETISRYRCLIWDSSNNAVYSNVVRLLLTPELKIARHPANAPGGAAGTYAGFSLSAEGEGLTYQWQFEYANSGNWYSIAGSESIYPGANTDHFRVLIQNDTALYRFRCAVTDKNGNIAYSNVVRVIPSDELIITLQPQNAGGREGSQVLLTVAVAGGVAPYSYQWQSFSQQVWQNLQNEPRVANGVRTDTLELVVSEADWTTHEKLRCVISDSAGHTVTSDAVSVSCTGASAYNVVFDANGGSGIMAKDFAPVGSDGYAQYTLPECGFAAPYGKEFDSWQVSGGAGNSSAFSFPASPGESVRINGNIKVTALWKTAADPCAGYTDINRSLWYHSAVDFVIARGYMGSTKTDTLVFEPNTKVSRAMVTSILYRLAGSPAVSYRAAFTDVPAGKWYTGAVEWAAQNGLASGKGDGRFDPNGNVTRQELAVFMLKMAEYLGKNTAGRADLSRFADAAKVSSWAKSYMQWAVYAGLISGKTSNGKTLLAPADTAVRAEFAGIIMRFVQNIAEK